MISTHQSWFKAAYTSTSSPIIIGGSGRSGTTLLRVILDTHSQIACGPESNLFMFPLELDPQGRNFLSSTFDISTNKNKPTHDLTVGVLGYFKQSLP